MSDASDIMKKQEKMASRGEQEDTELSKRAETERAQHKKAAHGSTIKMSTDRNYTDITVRY